MKTCSRCKRTLPETLFRQQIKNLSGLSSWCNDCINAVNREYINSSSLAQRRKWEKNYRDRINPTRGLKLATAIKRCRLSKKQAAQLLGVKKLWLYRATNRRRIINKTMFDEIMDKLQSIAIAEEATQSYIYAVSEMLTDGMSGEQIESAIPEIINCYLFGMTEQAAYDEIAWGEIDNEPEPPRQKDVINDIRTMAINGLSAKEIADKLGFNRNTVNRLLHTHGLIKAVPKYHKFGKAHGRAKLTEKDVIDILTIRMSKRLTYKDIADKYDVAASTIRSICIGKTWNNPSLEKINSLRQKLKSSQ